MLSDDLKDIVNNPYLRWLSVANVVDILNPWGQARLFTANYAPVHLLAHMLERLLFGSSMLGYHVVNVLVHAGNGVLLARLLERSGVSRRAALLGALFFVVHPACVEAVAWVSQLKTNGALAFCLGALLARERRPGLAAALFALGLLTKTTAVAALPAAVALAIARREPRASFRWLGLWALLFVLYALPQLSTYDRIAAYEVPALADPAVHARTIAAIFARYVAMAATAHGVGAYQELPPVRSPLDPWWLASLPLLAAIAWRIGQALRRRRQEAAWWLFALGGFAPVSQLFPFLYPIADRYLYFILPGLCGAFLLMLRPIPIPRLAASAAGAACVVLLAAFSWQTRARAQLWGAEDLLIEEAAARDPSSESARWLRACDAGRRGDTPAVIEELRASGDGGTSRALELAYHSCFSAVRDDPAFDAYVREAAGRWLELARERSVRTQAVLRTMAHAHLLRGELRRARDLVIEARELPGPLRPLLRRELVEIQDRIQERRRAARAAREGEAAGEGGEAREGGGAPEPAQSR